MAVFLSLPISSIFPTYMFISCLGIGQAFIEVLTKVLQNATSVLNAKRPTHFIMESGFG